MSAINIAIKRDSVHVITDGASYDATGRLLAIGPKVQTLPHINAAVAGRGPKLSVPFFAELFSTARTYDELREAAPGILKQVWSAVDATFVQCAFGTDFDVIIAGISESAGPDAYLICNHHRHGVEPFAAVQLAELSILPGDLEIRARFIDRVPHDIEAFDPERDGLAVLEAQRAHRVKHPGERWLASVGGFAQVTSITRDGISTRVVHRWDDEVGQPIGLSAAKAMLETMGFAA